MLGAPHNTLIVASVSQALRLDGELPTRLIRDAPRWVAGILVVLHRRTDRRAADLAGLPACPLRLAPPRLLRQVVDLPSILRANLFGAGRREHRSECRMRRPPAFPWCSPAIIADQDPQTRLCVNWAVGHRDQGLCGRRLASRGGAACIRCSRTACCWIGAAPSSPCCCRGAFRPPRLLRRSPWRLPGASASSSSCATTRA